jgi:hypothetical protein
MPRSRLWLRLALLLPLGVGPLGADDPAPSAEPEEMTYVTSAEVAARLADLEQAAARGGPRTSVSEYGKSARGTPLLALWVGEPGRPLVLVHGGLAANDAAGTRACLHLAQRLAAGDGAEALARVAYVLIPAPNPDALDDFLLGMPRAGGGALDRDLDGRTGEDGPDDVNGDGAVTRMRRRSPRGTWALASEVELKDTPATDARRMLEKGLDPARAASYELFEEGRDDDGDGVLGEDPPGMDLTRNMAGWWDHQGPWGGEGPYAGSAPETRALMEFSFGLTNLVAWYGFRAEGPWLLRANEHGSHADADNALYDGLGAALTAHTGIGVKRASEATGGVRNPGSDLDWAAVHLGVPAFALPVWRIAKEAAHKVDRPCADETDWLLWNDRVLGGSGFAPWTPFEHPTLGPVEIGGWKRFTRHEPPPRFLGDAVRSVAPAPLVHARFVPALALDLEVEDRGDGLFRLKVRARNRGTAPTEPALAAARKLAHPVRVTLALEDGVERLGGPVVGDAGVLAPGASSAPLTWLVKRSAPRPGRANEPLLGALTASHRVAGRVTIEVKAP